jgi:hypothetical protein
MRYLGFWLYNGCRDFPHFLQTQGHHAKSIGTLELQDRFDILLEMRLSGIAGLRYTMLYGKSQFKFVFVDFENEVNVQRDFFNTPTVPCCSGDNAWK